MGVKTNCVWPTTIHKSSPTQNYGFKVKRWSFRRIVNGFGQPLETLGLILREKRIDERQAQLKQPFCPMPDTKKGVKTEFFGKRRLKAFTSSHCLDYSPKNGERRFTLEDYIGHGGKHGIVERELEQDSEELTRILKSIARSTLQNALSNALDGQKKLLSQEKIEEIIRFVLKNTAFCLDEKRTTGQTLGGHSRKHSMWVARKATRMAATFTPQHAPSALEIIIFSFLHDVGKKVEHQARIASQEFEVNFSIRHEEIGAGVAREYFEWLRQNRPESLLCLDQQAQRRVYKAIYVHGYNGSRPVNLGEPKTPLERACHFGDMADHVDTINWHRTLEFATRVIRGVRVKIEPFFDYTINPSERQVAQKKQKDYSKNNEAVESQRKAPEDITALLSYGITRAEKQHWLVRGAALFSEVALGIAGDYRTRLGTQTPEMRRIYAEDVQIIMRRYNKGVDLNPDFHYLFDPTTQMSSEEVVEKIVKRLMKGGIAKLFGGDTTLAEKSVRELLSLPFHTSVISEEGSTRICRHRAIEQIIENFNSSQGPQTLKQVFEQYPELLWISREQYQQQLVRLFEAYKKTTGTYSEAFTTYAQSFVPIEVLQAQDQQTQTT